MNHRSLCDLAVKWLKRQNSAGGHGCHIAVSETKGGWSGEIPDAIGFRATGDFSDGSVVVEVKTSRSDFLADRRKKHRQENALAMGKWRYYLCPEGVIAPEELPEKWGLLYVNKHKHIKLIMCPFKDRHYGNRKLALEEMAFDDRDFQREQFLLVKLLSRIGDVEDVNKKYKEAYKKDAEAETKLSQVRKEKAKLDREKTLLRIGMSRNTHGTGVCNAVEGVSSEA